MLFFIRVLDDRARGLDDGEGIQQGHGTDIRAGPTVATVQASVSLWGCGWMAVWRYGSASAQEYGLGSASRSWLAFASASWCELESWSARAMTIPPGGDRDSLSRGLEKLG